MFSWAMREGLAVANPCVDTNRREERPRERVLKDRELALVWHATGDGDYGTVIRLLILTGQRLTEIADLRWSEIDFDRGVISLSGARTKNGQPHEIPMSDTVRQLLAARTRSEGRVFGNGRGGMAGWSRRKRRLDKKIAGLNNDTPLPGWVHHDLRRSAATGMAEIGIVPHVIEAVLNHQSGHKGGIAGIYNRASYAREKSEALALWDKHIREIV
jgi:integrase